MGAHIFGALILMIGTNAILDLAYCRYEQTKQKKNSMVLVRKRTIPTERPSHVGEVSANFSG
jgi:hypothetical protein